MSQVFSDPRKSDLQNLAGYIQRREQELGIAGLPVDEKLAALQRHNEETRVRLIERKRDTLRLIQAKLGSALERDDGEEVITAYRILLAEQEPSLAQSLEEQH